MKHATWLYSITSLLIANLLPLYGVIFWGWNVFFLMLLYWLESLIIGFFNFIKINRAEGKALSKLDLKVNGQPLKDASAFSLSAFFLLHYGLFMFVHLIFILVFFFSKEINLLGLFSAFVSLCLSHFISYQGHFIGNREYERVSADDLFMKPYPRIIIMHLTILLGGALAFSTGQSTLALGIMVFLKILADLGLHTWSHYQLAAKV